MYSKLSETIIQLEISLYTNGEILMVSEKLLRVIACPETKQDLVVADDAIVQKINDLIEQGELLNRSKQKVSEKIDGGLIQKEDRKYLYPIRDEIPILLIDESIPLDSI